jgi:hypothetical protein
MLMTTKTNFPENTPAVEIPFMRRRSHRRPRMSVASGGSDCLVRNNDPTTPLVDRTFQLEVGEHGDVQQLGAGGWDRAPPASSRRPEGPSVLPSQPPGDLRRAVPCQRAQHQDQAIQGLNSRPPACLRPSQRLPMQGSMQGWPLSDRRRGVRSRLRPSHQRPPLGVHRRATGRRAACASEPAKDSQSRPHSAIRLHVPPREM